MYIKFLAIGAMQNFLSLLNSPTRNLALAKQNLQLRFRRYKYFLPQNYNEIQLRRNRLWSINLFTIVHSDKSFTFKRNSFLLNVTHI